MNTDYFDWLADQPLNEVDRQGLQLLSHGPHCIGLIDDEAKLAAAVVLHGLQRRGYAMSAITPEGPRYHLTPKGQAALLEACHD